jgi:Uma2 family endonuclease
MDPRMESEPRRHRISVDEYYRMAEVGLLAPDARVELVEGEIIDMPPIGSLHGSVVDQLAQLLMSTVADRAIVRVQGAVRLNRMTEVQPDLALLAPRADFYRSAQPTGTDTLLVIEVSDSTLRYDREVKVPLYARHGVPEVWIVDLQNGRLVCYRSLRGGEYHAETPAAPLAKTRIEALPGSEIDLSRLLV